MKKIISPCIFFILVLTQSNLYAQNEEMQVSLQEEIQLEAQVSESENSVDDDSYILQLGEFKKHKISVNTANEETLRELRILNDLQIRQLLIYRSLFGAFISLYELQAVPGLDVETLRRIKPYISLKDGADEFRKMKERLKGGSSDIMLRSSIVPEKVVGFLTNDSGETKYEGKGAKIFLRYRYNFKNQLQYGIVGEKDPGEAFLKGSQKKGFDFYSYHLFIRKYRSIHALAIGDYTVSMGQGLVHWQSNGLRKNADVMLVKRQSEVLRPYRSAGEYNFLRGTGITFRLNRVYASVFASYRRYSATTDADSSGSFFTTINTSGYHRTVPEINRKNNLSNLSLGGVIKFMLNRGSVSVNTMNHFFSLPMRAQDKPYDLYGATGKSMNNISIDYSYNFLNFHTYGEVATDKNGNLAMVHGLLTSMGKGVDLSLVYRNIGKAYQAFAANTFTENSVPSNERGLYAGVSIKPDSKWVLNFYVDFFSSPWLRFKTDAPSAGQGYLIQVLHKPDRKTEIYSRFSAERKPVNLAGASAVLPEIMPTSRREWRLQFSTQMSKALLFRSRVSLSWYDQNDKTKVSKGFLGYTDLAWKPMQGWLSGSLRLQYFDVDDYDARIYSYENGPLYDMSIPAVFEKGWRYYVNARIRFGRLPLGVLPEGEVTAWVRWAQTLKPENIATGSGNDLLAGPMKSEVKIQVLVTW
ncbi:MAG: helix-hairpin-helix domain-containing protein [Chitinophagaceae bacterium]|nr:MAG: helix-hairpin-helix domain-containing protein [Chitinophagaceae bacterium]